MAIRAPPANGRGSSARGLAPITSSAAMTARVSHQPSQWPPPILCSSSVEVRPKPIAELPNRLPTRLVAPEATKIRSMLSSRRISSSTLTT